MVPCTEDAWKAILARVEDTGADGVELNFGCPHGMSERGMGAAVGQVPEYIEMVTALVQGTQQAAGDREAHAQRHRHPAARAAAKKGGADAVSPDQHHQLDHGRRPRPRWRLSPSTGGMGSHGGYCGPAVKPIALHMVAEIAARPETAGLPISGIGGIATWRDAARLHGAGRRQRAGVHRGDGITASRSCEDMIDGLSDYMDDMGYRDHRRLPGPGACRRSPTGST